MELTVDSETSANHNLTPGKYPKEYIQYYLGDKIKKNEMGGSSSTMGEKRGASRFFVGRPEGRRLLGIPRLRWEDDIKVGLKKLDGLD
jgi:hypothetical protein